MELEIYDAFRSAGVADDKAKAAVESINREIDKRYSLHSQQLAPRGDIAEVQKEIAEVKADLMKSMAEFKVDIIKWTMGSMFTAVALFATIIKIWQ
jgi:xylose isomerase